MSDVSVLAREMPMLARTLGVWDGTYTRVDTQGEVLDRHHSRLTCSWLETGTYLQVNEYSWEDGRHETIHFPATLEDRRLRFDTDRIAGEAWEIGANNMVLNWSYKHDPTGFLWELITLTNDFSRKSRTWQHFAVGELVAVTVIEEKRVG